MGYDKNFFRSQLMIIMEGKELVLHFHEGETKYCVITFPGRFHSGEARDTFFGESIFKKYNISSIGLTTKLDNWFICDEIDEFIEKIKSITEKYETIVAIGPSMGSYPAIKYSNFLKIHRILALAPKWTIDPNIINLENEEIKNGLLSGNMDDVISSIYSEEKKGHCIQSGDVYNELIVCYDQHNELDRSHSIKLKSILDFESVLFPMCGHVIIEQLQGAENLKKIVHSLVYDDIKITCKILSKIRRSHKNKIQRYYDIAHEKHPYYCFLMIRKFIDTEFSGYKDFLFRQNIFSNLMDKSIRKKVFISKEIEIYFRTKLISQAHNNKNLTTYPIYRSEIFNVMDFHGGRLEYSLRDNTLFSSNYFFGSRDFTINVFAKKIGTEIFLITLFDGQTFHLQFKDGKILLGNFTDDAYLLRLSPLTSPQQNGFSYENNFEKEIFKVVMPQGYMMSSPDGNIIFNSPNLLTWENFSLHAALDERATPPPDNIHQIVETKPESGFSTPDL